MTSRRGKKSSVPKRGDPDYLTPTQLRNRRKRRAKRQGGGSSGGDIDGAGAPSSSSSTPDRRAVENGRKKSRPNHRRDLGGRRQRDDDDRVGGGGEDPSTAYISDPTRAPIVDAARRYLEPILSSSSSRYEDDDDNDDGCRRFRVHLGPVEGWRTVSKLAVRPASSSHSSAREYGASSSTDVVAIGLFRPRSHALVPVPNCVAHHDSINVAVACVERACRRVGVTPYRGDGGRADAHIDDIDGGVGVGQLRYVAINVERGTGGAQITLVWNADPPPPRDDDYNGEYDDDDDDDDDATSSKRKYDGGIASGIDDPDLAKLVARIVSTSYPSTTATTTTTDVVVGGGNGDYDDPSTTKRRRRRRGRQEGKSTRDLESNVVPWMGGGGDAGVVDDGGRRRRRRRSSSSCGDVFIADNDDDGGPSRAPLVGGTSDDDDDDGGKPCLHSLWINYNRSSRHSNAIFANDSACWRCVVGPRAITEYLTFGDGDGDGDGGATTTTTTWEGGERLPRRRRTHLASARPPPFAVPLNFPPNVFRQANLDAFAGIIGRIRERIVRYFDDCGRPACVELYGGVGTIGLHVSDLVSSLVCSDENPNNATCFCDSVAALPAEIRPRLVYRRKNAADMIASELALFGRCRLLIVDPPRKGLDVEVVDYLCGGGWKTMKLVIYVSCGFQAFQRDCDALLGSGRWKITSRIDLEERHVHGRPTAAISVAKFPARPPPFAVPLNFPPNVFPPGQPSTPRGASSGGYERGSCGTRATAAVPPAWSLYGDVGTIGLHVSDLVSSLVLFRREPEQRDLLPRFRGPRCPPKLARGSSTVGRTRRNMIASELALFGRCRAAHRRPSRKGLDVEVVDYLCGGDGKL
ncbi:hypothetical protein ACHAW5_005726 [Stephanodiscus triporus]|uniref:Trimethylguanosine synthase n=1 Tax=Stephanodiscus triporus TaxID=2934178 RepID=A0ABD3R2L9_9STRA